MGEKKKTDKNVGLRKALYRKYRSKNLEEIKGQEHITKTLKNAVEQGKISHAYLFTGPRGVGKTSIARILAHEINQLPYEDETTHLDIIEIDAASNRRIDDIRDLREKVHIAPVSAKYKVYIIDEVHMLTSESFNALLKTLEEPPAHVIFILATTEVHKLPATIVSRTQRHSFKSISSSEIADHLAQIAKKEGIKISESALNLLADHGEGSFRDSISLLDQISSHQKNIEVEDIELMLGLVSSEKIAKLQQAIDKNNPSDILLMIENLIDSGVTPQSIAMQLIKEIRRKIQEGTKDSGNLVQLMDGLVQVGGSQYPKLKLETVLLMQLEDLNSPTDIPKTSSKPALVENKQPSVTLKTEPKKNSTKQPSTTHKPERSNNNIDTLWPEILNKIKLINNPLYTVLRLAQPELIGEKLILSFDFSFHQKRADDSKHKAILASVVNEITGINTEVETFINKSSSINYRNSDTTDQIKLPAENANASLIEGIRDIMGGGEVVSA